MLFAVAGCQLPWQPTEQEVLRNSAEAMSVLNSFTVSAANITAKGKFVDPDDYEELATGEQPQPSVNGTVTMDFNGKTETFYKTPQPDYQFNFSGKMTVEGDEYPYAYETRGVGPIVYFNFATLPGFADESIDLSGLTNKWWEVSRSQVQSFYTPVPTVEEEPSTTEEEPEELTPEQEQQIADLFAETKFFILEENFGKEKCANEKKAYHYKVRLDEEATKNFYVQYYEIIGDPMTTDELEDLEDMLAAIAKMEIETWIQTRDYYLCRVTAKGNYVEPNTKQTYDISVDANMTDFNTEEFTVSAPAGAKAMTPENVLKALGLNVNSILNNIFGSGSSDTSSDTSDTSSGSSDSSSGSSDLDNAVNDLKKLFGN